MALVFLGASQCSICGELLVHGQSIVGTSHFIADTTHPLWRFSDSGMHADCFDEWAHRDEFSALYYAALGRILPGWDPAVAPVPGESSRSKIRVMVFGTTESRGGYFAALRSRVSADAELVVAAVGKGG